MDLSQDIKATSLVYDVKHPATEKPLGLRVTLRPSTDPEVEKAQRRFQNERLAKRKVTAEQLEAFSIELLKATVAGWDVYNPTDKPEDVLTLEGQPFPEYSPLALAKVLRIKWLRKQLEDASGNDADFFQN